MLPGLLAAFRLPGRGIVLPNTLVHLAVQGAGSRLISDRIDLKWVFLGCIIPDIPWILRRALIELVPGIDLYSVTLYAGVQASLAFCLLLALMFAQLSARPRPVFFILAVNALVHLLLDATEIKWGNGVFLLAPFNWQLLNFGWIWPDSTPVALLSIVGLVVSIWFLVRPATAAIVVSLRSGRRLLAALALLGVYVLSPLVLLHGPLSADLLSIATLKDTGQRLGREVRMERRPYVQESGEDVIITLAGESLRVVGDTRASSPQVSVIGEFVDQDAIRIDRLHEYRAPWRDLASYAGLGLVLVFWCLALWRERARV